MAIAALVAVEVAAEVAAGPTALLEVLEEVVAV